MEGVVVSAKPDGSTITISVISDDKGHFNRRRRALILVITAIGIRAVGYDIDGAKDTTVAAGQDNTIDIKLLANAQISARK